MGMAHRNDRDPSSEGGTVTQITSTSRERAAARNAQASAVPPPRSDPEIGTNFFECFDLTAEERNGREFVDDVLAHHAAATGPPRTPGRADPVDDRLDAITDGHDAIQEQLEHHHERSRPRAHTGSPRGSADLAGLTPRTRRRPSMPQMRRARVAWRGPRITTRGALGLVAVVIIAAAAVTDLIHHPAASAAHHTAGAVTAQHSAASTGFTTLASISDATRALGLEREARELAAREKTLRARHAKAERRARERAEAAKRRRAREQRARVKRHHAQHSSTSQSHASAPPTDVGSQSAPSVSQTTTVITTTEQPPVQSSGSSGPAGPIGPGSSSGGCDPQCR